MVATFNLLSHATLLPIQHGDSNHNIATLGTSLIDVPHGMEYSISVFAFRLQDTTCCICL